MHLEALVRAAVEQALLQLKIPFSVEVPVDRPPRPEYGDLSSRVAFLVARAAQRSPDQLSQEIASLLEGNPAFASVTAEGGFVNLRFAQGSLGDVVRGALVQGEDYGRGDAGGQRPLQVEFVSSNPTGPLTVGHGRQAVLGDVVSELWARQGWQVTREYYLNDEGRQIELLGQSLWARYRQAVGDDVGLPEGGYHGEYLLSLGQELAARWGDRCPEWTTATQALFCNLAVKQMMDMICEDLEAVGVDFDVWSKEGELHRRGVVEETLDALRERGAVYEHEGALWLRSTEHGLGRDPVLLRSAGGPTYLMVDIAYHVEKYRRGFAKVVDMQGADHVEEQQQVKLALSLLGMPDDFLDYCLHQFVTLRGRNGMERMSTRAGRFLRLRDLVEELGRDVFRYFMVMRKPSSHLNFNYELAKSSSMENPVYYVQYAHTRIASLKREALRLGEYPEHPGSVDLAPLEDPSERALMLEIDRFGDLLRTAAVEYAPHLLCEYLENVAGLFHPYYSRVRVLGQGETTHARLAMLSAVGLVLRQGLTVLGLTTPEEM
ncbi:MAG: arginine--tRNA ligase [Candidatus Bipolaricaulota bacterium]